MYQYTWLNEFDLAGQTAGWLRSACAERGLLKSGNRDALMARLVAHEQPEHPVTTSTPATRRAHLSVVDPDYNS